MRIQTLGSAEIIIGQTAVRPDSAVAFGLLLYLGVTAGDRVPRARLVELFWPDQPETQSRHALRQLLYRLRRIGLPLAEGGEELRVDTTVVDCDAAPMLAPSWSTVCSERDAMNASQFLTDFNPEISGPFSEWLDDLRNRVARRYSEAARRHLGVARREARWTDVFDWSTRCLAVDPLNQDATFALAESTAMRGAKVEAVRILDEYSREIGALDGRVGLSTKVLRQRVSEAHGIERNDGSNRLPMVGRDAEIARLVRIVEDVARGQGGVTWISGAAGIGKSRLATELRREAVIRGFSSMMIGLQSGDRQRPFSILSDMVAQLLKMPGALGCAPETLTTLRRLVAYHESPPGVEIKPPEPAVQQYEIREAIADLLGALESEAPLMVFIDDYHNGDVSSVPILTDLIERTATARVLWLMTSRPSVERPPFQLRATIDLKPLPESACRLLVESTVPRLREDERQRLTDACVQIAGGNPFFAREVIQFWDRSGDDKQLPSSVARAVTDQVSRLGLVTTRVIQVIALLGSIATLRRVTRIMDCHVSELLKAFEELDSIGIASLADDDALLTVHDIWREEVLKSIRPMVRQVLHARIADVVEAEARDLREVSLFWEAASHRGESGDPEIGMRLLLKFGGYLITIGLPNEAAETLGRALRYCSTDEQRLSCIRERIGALHAAGHWKILQSEIVEAREIADRVRTTGDSHDELELLAIEALWRTEQDSPLAMSRARDCGFAPAASKEHRVAALQLCSIIADNLCNDLQLHNAHRELMRLSTDDPRFLKPRLIAMTIANTRVGDVQIAIDSCAAWIQHERESGGPAGLGRALRFSTYPLRIAGAFSTAIENAREALLLSERYQLAEDASICCDILATTALSVDDLPLALEMTARTSHWAQKADVRYWRVSAALLRSKCARAAGSWRETLEALGTDTDPFTKDPILTQGLDCLAALVDAYRLQRSRPNVDRVVRAMESMLAKTVSRGRIDEYVLSYCEGLLYLGRSHQAQKYLENFLNKERREQFENKRLTDALKRSSYK